MPMRVLDGASIQKTVGSWNAAIHFLVESYVACVTLRARSLDNGDDQCSQLSELDMLMYDMVTDFSLLKTFKLNKPWVEKVNTVLGPHCKFLGSEIWKELCAEMLNESAAN